MINKNLEQLRIEKGLTKKEVAILLNIDQSTYGKYELGKREPDYSMLKKIAEIFKVSTDFILGVTTLNNTNDYSQAEKQLINNYRSLNEEGQHKINDYIDDLVSSGKYKKFNTDRMDKEKKA